MRFIVDECIGPAVVHWLCGQKHEVFSVYEEARGMEDEAVLAKAFAEDWILITNDKDFGEKVYRDRRPHKDIVLLRLEDERAANKIAALQRLLKRYADQLPNRFVVVAENQVRFVRSEEQPPAYPSSQNY